MDLLAGVDLIVRRDRLIPLGIMSCLVEWMLYSDFILFYDNRE